MGYRDQIYRRVDVSSHFYVQPSGACSIYPGFPSGSSVTKQLRKATGRSDITKSDGTTATFYRAWRIDTNPIGGKVFTPYRHRCANKPYPFTTSQQIWEGNKGLADFYLHYGMTRYGNVDDPLSIHFETRGNTHVIKRVHNQILAAIKDGNVDYGETIVGLLGTAYGMSGRLMAAGAALLALKRGNAVDARKYAQLMTRAIIPRSSKDRRRNFRRFQKDFKRGSKALANGYLSGIFGWAPLIRDIMNSRQAIIDAFAEPGPQFSITRKSQSTIPAAVIYPLNPKGSGSITMGTQMGLKYRVENSFFAGLNQLGLYNPFLTAWQALPLSFVVDWFVSISAFLSGLNAGVGLQFVGGYQTNYVRGSYTLTDYSGFSLTSTGEFPKTKTKYFGMERIPTSSFPSPGIVVRLPNVGSKVATMAALLRQRL